MSSSSQSRVALQLLQQEGTVHAACGLVDRAHQLLRALTWIRSAAAVVMLGPMVHDRPQWSDVQATGPPRSPMHGVTGPYAMITTARIRTVSIEDHGNVLSEFLFIEFCDI
jgi:hypothetical protein